MKKYTELLPVYFIFFFQLSPLIGWGYSNVVSKIQAEFKLHFDNRAQLPSDSLPAATQKGKSHGWEILFNGKNTDKWRSKNSETFPSGGWIIKDGSLFLNKKGRGILPHGKNSAILNLTWTST